MAHPAEPNPGADGERQGPSLLSALLAIPLAIVGVFYLLAVLAAVGGMVMDGGPGPPLPSAAVGIVFLAASAAVFIGFAILVRRA